MRSLLLIALPVFILLLWSAPVSAQDQQVLAAQKFLTDNGYQPGGIDGIMGANTRRALSKFQSDNNIIPDGILGEQTLNKISELTNQEEISESSIDDINVVPVQENLITEPRVITNGSNISTEKEKPKIPTVNDVIEPNSTSNTQEVLIERLEPILPSKEKALSNNIEKTQPAITDEQAGELDTRVNLQQTEHENLSEKKTTPILGWVVFAGIVIWFWKRRSRKKASKVKSTTKNKKQKQTSKTLRKDHKSVAKSQSINTQEWNFENEITLELTNLIDEEIITELKLLDNTNTNVTQRHGPRTAKITPAKADSGFLSSPTNSAGENLGKIVVRSLLGGKSPDSPKVAWVKSGETKTISGRDIGGMVYVGIPPRIGSNGKVNNAFINPSLTVSRRGTDFDGDELPYWPSYTSINANCRATYLDWLANGRADSRYDAGYMFLYFYGLEYRFFRDESDLQERKQILQEVERLLGLYAFNRSAERYLSAFIDAASLMLNQTDDFQPIYSNTGYELPSILKLAIGRKIASGETLNADWVLSWLMCDPETNLRTPAHRCKEEFRTLFIQNFKTKFPTGMKIRRSKRQLKIDYQSASGMFVENLATYLGAVPDISTSRKPVSDAFKIADEAMDELDKLSRFLGRNPDSRRTLEAFAYLPVSLRSSFPCDATVELQKWANKVIESGGLVQLAEVLQKIEGDVPENVGKKLLLGICDILASIGFGFAPDPRFALRSPKLGEPVVLFNLPSNQYEITQPSIHYRTALTELGLSVFVAWADGNVVPSEEAALKKSIVDAANITKSEKVRLAANLIWLLKVPQDLSKLRSRLKEVDEDQRQVFQQTVLAMVHADSIISPKEIIGVEKIYKTLGLDPNTIYSDLHATRNDSPLLDAGSEQSYAKTGGLSNRSDSSAENSLKLDSKRIADIVSDTKKVSIVLSEIFTGDMPDQEDMSELEQTEPENRTLFDGLDPKHSALTDELIQQATWTEEEFEILANRYDVLASGCLEAINEWAFEKFDDALIEEYNGYEINAALVKLIRDRENRRIE